MRKTSSVGIVGAALAAAFGAFAFACETSSTPANGASPEHPDGGGALGDGVGTTLADGGGEHSPDAARTDGTLLPCENPKPVVLGGKDTGFVECTGDVWHRASVVACPNTLPRADSTCTNGFGIDAGAGGCTSDADCTAKPYGTCNPGGGHFPTCGCSYGCLADADCGDGKICECGSPVGRCVAAKCSSDGACAAGSLCARTATGWGGCSWDPLAPSYVCQTKADTCFTAKQCAGNTPACAFDADAGARTCHEGQMACPGRPFLVEGTARLAATTTRRDWAAPVGETRFAALALEPELRRVLADHWTRTAQMEHASIAAFARFTLELLALGAPAELVIAAQAAMADETRHAQLAFGLASAYASAPVGPDGLSIDGALGRVSAESMFATLFREGCIGETLAAVEATEASLRAAPGSVRDALVEIARDETKHAELSWHTARWLVATQGGDFRVWASAEAARAIGERYDELGRASGRLPPSADDAALAAAHGLLDDATRRTVAVAALREIVEPARSLLLEERGAPNEPRPSTRARASA